MEIVLFEEKVEDKDEGNEVCFDRTYRIIMTRRSVGLS